LLQLHHETLRFPENAVILSTAREAAGSVVIVWASVRAWRCRSLWQRRKCDRRRVSVIQW